MSTSPDPDISTVASRIVYENPWMSLSEDLVEFPDGTTGTYAVLHSRDFVVVIPFDGTHFHLVEQFRYPVGRRLWEFPQGSVADPSATPERVAAIELAEEAQLAAHTLTPLGYLHESNGRSTIGFHAFLATGLESTIAERDPQEFDMRTGMFTPEELWQLVDSGQFTDAASLAALMLLTRLQTRPAPQ